MSGVEANTKETSLEHKFARDLIRFVLYERMLGLHWTPTEVFAEYDFDSPFTPEFKYAIIKELDSHGHNFHRLYDINFPDKSIVQERHYYFCWDMKYQFVRLKFDKKYFIMFCAQLANYAGLSYLYGARNAPYESYVLLVICIRELKFLNKIDDKFWNVMQNWLEGREIVEDKSDDQIAFEDITDVSYETKNELEDLTEIEDELED